MAHAPRAGRVRQRSGDPAGDAREQGAGTSVLIADDHPLVLHGLRILLEDAGIATIYEARDAVSAHHAFDRFHPQVVVTDLSFEDRGLSGLSLIERIRAHDRRARILVFSMHTDPVVIARAVESGAIGYVFKDAPAATFHAAFDAVRGGCAYLDHDVATRLAFFNLTKHQVPATRLNNRELEIFALLGQGISKHNIATKLSINYKTVVSHCSSMRQKLELATDKDLLRIAIEQGLISDLNMPARQKPTEAR
ncbi:response regulator transcription factor [Methylobacterium planeticum]|uniref:Response regulator transcription factor n=2 Tax=Methylobacterium planeticum TaxID=2615211 RepID=A0A6N6MV29_9HYPH|nr:response regulator transcription factor [Methylobacterium planeticum]